MKAVFVALFAGALGCVLFQPVQAADAARFNEKVLWSFGSGTDGQYPEAGLIDKNGTLYGVTEYGGVHDKGTMFSVDPGTGTETVLYSFCSKRPRYCLDGEVPLATLIGSASRSQSILKPGPKSGSIPFAASLIAPTAGIRLAAWSP